MQNLNLNGNNTDPEHEEYDHQQQRLQDMHSKIEPLRRILFDREDEPWAKEETSNKVYCTFAGKQVELIKLISTEPLHDTTKNTTTKNMQDVTNHFKMLEKTSANIVTSVKPNSTSDCIYMTVYGNYDTIYTNFKYLCRTYEKKTPYRNHGPVRDGVENPDRH